MFLRLDARGGFDHAALDKDGKEPQIQDTGSETYGNFGFFNFGFKFVNNSQNPNFLELHPK